MRGSAGTLGAVAAAQGSTAGGTTAREVPTGASAGRGGPVVVTAAGGAYSPEVARVLGGLVDADACFVRRPVTDAVKVVQAGLVTGSVDRHGLTHVQLPYVVRREAVTAQVAACAADAPGAVAAALLAAGRIVRVVPDGAV